MRIVLRISEVFGMGLENASADFVQNGGHI